MKKNYQTPATTVILVQPTQLMEGSQTIKSMKTGDTGITYQGGATVEGMSRRGDWDDDEE